MKVYRAYIIEGRTGNKKVYKGKACDAGDFIDRIALKYRGDQPIEVKWVKVVED